VGLRMSMARTRITDFPGLLVGIAQVDKLFRWRAFATATGVYGPIVRNHVVQYRMAAACVVIEGRRGQAKHSLEGCCWPRWRGVDVLTSGARLIVISLTQRP